MEGVRYKESFVMSKLTVNNAVLAQLSACADEVELCDSPGMTVGRFVPSAAYGVMLHARAKALFTDAELEQAQQQPGGCSTAELLERLKKLRTTLSSGERPHKTCSRLCGSPRGTETPSQLPPTKLTIC